MASCPHCGASFPILHNAGCTAPPPEGRIRGLESEAAALRADVARLREREQHLALALRAIARTGQSDALTAAWMRDLARAVLDRSAAMPEKPEMGMESRSAPTGQET